MDHHLKDFYRRFSEGAPRGNFHSVIALHEAKDFSWNEIKEKVPELTRGWFELAHLTSKDRIDFSRDYWLTKMPYRQGFDEFLNRFFASLDDIGIFITQKKYDDPYEARLVYSIKNDGGFFCGAPPISEQALGNLQKAFSNFILPNDYLIFLQIHNGFSKTTDCTGIMRAEDLPQSYANFQANQSEPILTSKKTFIDPKTLVPFYESFGMPFYQCFWADWYPEQEMGNVYYSAESKTISDIYSNASSAETMAYPTFTDWLMFYMERFI